MIERVVRRGWAGLETMTAAGVDFGSVFDGLRQWINAEPEPIAIGAFHDRLALALRPAGDNHFAFFWFTEKGHAERRSVGRREHAYTAEIVVSLAKNGELSEAQVGGASATRGDLVDCDGSTASTFRPTVLASGEALVPATRPIALSETPPPPMRCRIRLPGGAIRTVELPMRRLRLGTSTTRDRKPAFELKDAAIPVITLRTFWSGKETELARFVASATKVRDSKAVILDVRGNGGGSDTYAKDWLAELTSQRLYSLVVERLDSEVTRQGIVNDNTCQLAEGLDDPAARQELDGRMAWANKTLAEARQRGELMRTWQQRTFDEGGRAPSAFRAPLVALIDNECASACESLLSRARQLESTVVVGENSGGVGVFAEVLVYRLPKSGLGMAAGMKRFRDRDASRSVVEGRGHLPDLWLDTDDPIALSERIAECLTKATCPLRSLLQ
jgi:hypothetical protein